MTSLDQKNNSALMASLLVNNTIYPYISGKGAIGGHGKYPALHVDSLNYERVKQDLSTIIKVLTRYIINYCMKQHGFFKSTE